MKEHLRFYNICNKMMELKPWDYLGHEEYCQLFLDKFDIPILVNVIGDTLTFEFGFIICLDVLQSNYLLSFKENIKENEISKRRRYQYYSVIYKHYLELDVQEESFISKYLQLDEDSFYPVLEHNIWNSDKTSVRNNELNDICVILENLYLLLKSIALGKVEQPKRDQTEIPTRYFNSQTKTYDNIYAPFIIDLYCIKPEFKLSDKTYEMFETLSDTQLAVEYDLLYLPLVSDDGYVLVVYILYDYKKHQVLEMNLIKSNEDRIHLFVQTYINLTEHFGGFKEVRCRDSIDKRILESLDYPEKPIFQVKELKNIDQLIDEILDQFNKNGD